MSSFIIHSKYFYNYHFMFELNSQEQNAALDNIDLGLTNKYMLL